MPLRAIVILPQFDGLPRVEHLRRQFDPQAALLPAHLTLVFPFESDLSTEALRAHVMGAVRGVKPFTVRLQGITGGEGEYLFLNVKRGNDQLIELHDRLYTGPLSARLSDGHTYAPHLTVGRLRTVTAFAGALEIARQMTEAFQAVIREVSAIRVDSNSGVEFSVNLDN